MRVMIVSNIFPPHVRGGYELGMMEVARTFVRAGHEVEVVTSAAVGMTRKTLAPQGLTVRPVFAPVLAYESDLAERLDESSTWRGHRTDALGGIDVANAIALDTEIRRFRPERIWMGNPLGIGPVGILETALTAGVPVVLHLMDDIDRYLLSYRRPLSWLGRIRRIKRGITAVSCSAHVKDMNAVVGDYGEHRVIMNGIDFDSVTDRAQPGRHDGALRFVYAGQVEPMKGIPQLIDGVAELLRRHGATTAPFELDIIGPASPSYAAQLTDEIHAKGLAGCVHLVGRLDKPVLLRRLATYDAAVLLLKLEEPFGYAWLEAAAAGLPVVVTRGHVVGEAFPHDYPLFVNDRDAPSQVADALTFCLDRRDSLDRIGRALGAHLRQRCDTRTVVNPQYEAVLRSAKAPRTPAHCETLVASMLTCDAFGHAQDGWRMQ